MSTDHLISTVASFINVTFWINEKIVSDVPPAKHFRVPVINAAHGGCRVFPAATIRRISRSRSLRTARALESIVRLTESAARALYAGPIVAQMSFSEDRPAIDGLSPALIADFLNDRGADVVGVNCAEGPAFVFEVAREMLGHGRPVSAQPNAGRPRRLDERTIYMTTPEYFGVYARRLFQSGLALVGGCCGTGPEHIRRVVDAAAMLSGGRVKIEAARATVSVPEVHRQPPVPMERKSPLGAKLQRVYRERLDPAGPRLPVKGPESFVVSVEVNPDPGIDPARALLAAMMLKRAGADVVNTADGPRAVARMSNLARPEISVRLL